VNRKLPNNFFPRIALLLDKPLQIKHILYVYCIHIITRMVLDRAVERWDGFNEDPGALSPVGADMSQADVFAEVKYWDVAAEDRGSVGPFCRT
jgi:hypothetical protein